MNTRGAVPVESVFGLLLLATISIAIVQIALVVFARNVVASAAHEGARVAIERERDVSVAKDVAIDVVTSTTGGLVSDIQVVAETIGERLYVRISGRVDTVGPLPGAIQVSEEASALLIEDP